ncbi:MAG: ethylbenzene dehydrogenase-related protein [candidate division Zixibacteria bacterium]
MKISIRIINALTFAVFSYLSITGIRLMLFGNRLPLPKWLIWLQTMEFGYNTQLLHFYAGIALAGLLTIRIALRIISAGEKHSDRLNSNIAEKWRSNFAFAINLLLLSAIISGLLVYSGKITDQLFYASLKNMHLISFWGVLVVSVIYGIVQIIQRDRNENRITFKSKEGRRIWAALAAMILICTIVAWGVAEFVNTPMTLTSRRMNRNIVLDGRAHTIEWYGVDSVLVPVTGGDNFDNGSTNILVKSFRNRRYIFFLFQWQDESRSYNRQLIKTDSGWIEQKSDSSIFGESVYFEDQLAVSFHRSSSGCLESCHLGNSQQAGRHYTNGDTADVWIWRALSTNPVGEADDGWWAAAANDSSAGIRFDNSAGGGYASNLNREWDEPYFLSYHPAFRYWIDMRSKYFMPYRFSLDIFDVGAIQPAVVTAPFTGDRGDIRVWGNWANGVWTVELSRSLKTGSPFDIALMGTVWMSLAPFDNSEKMHSYHFKTIKLIIEK